MHEIDADKAPPTDHPVAEFAQLPAGEPETELYVGEVREPGTDRAQDEVVVQTQGALSRSVVLVGSKAATWVLAFVMTVMMPRYLGATGFGRLYLAMSLTGIVSILVEFGLNSLVAREVSRGRENATRYLVNAGLLKTGLWVVTFVALGLIVRIAEYPAETQAAVAILAVSVLFAGLSSLLVAILQADDRMRWIAVSTFAEKALYVGLGVAMLLLGHGVIAIAWVTLIGSAVGFLLDVWWFRLLAKQTDVHSGWRGLEIPALFVRSLPFFSVLVFGAIYFRIDVVILSFLASDETVGYYGAAYRLFQTTYILPDAFLFALFPLFCRLSGQDGDGLSVAAQKGLDLLLLIGLPIAAGICVLSSQIIAMLYGPLFSDSVSTLRVLSVAIALMYANGVFVQLLIATDRQKRLAVTGGAAALINVSVNFVLIPSYGALGAAIATVATEAIVIVMNYAFLPKELTGRLRYATPIKAGVASAVMAAVLLALGWLNLFALVGIGVAVYAVAVWALRAVPPEDVAMVKSALAKMGTA